MRSPARQPNWSRPFILLGVVSTGLSNVFFMSVIDHPSIYPAEWRFFFWFFFWGLLLPFAALLTIDVFIERVAGGGGREVRLWRSTLYTATILSFLRQFQIFFFHEQFPWNRHYLPWLLCAGTVALMFLVYRAHRMANLYFSYLGLFSLLTIGYFAYQAGFPWSACRCGTLDLGRDRTSRPPIFLIVFDELSVDILTKDGHIDPEAFPNFAALASDSAWFPRATTNSLFTGPALRCMLTGKRDPNAPADSLFWRLRNDYEILVINGDRGLRKDIREWSKGGENFVFRGHRFLLSHRPMEIARMLALILWHRYYLWDLFPALINESQGHVLTLNRFNYLTRSIEKDGCYGRLVYFHSSLPHYPFVYNAHGEVHENKARQFPDRTFMNPERYEEYRDQVRFTDTQLGHLLNALKERGVYEKALFMVTSDHGLRIWGDKWWEYPNVLQNRDTRIPLFIRAPFVKPGRYEADYQHLDFVPTLFDLLKYPYDPAEFDGVSAFAAVHPSPDRLCTVGKKTYRYDPREDRWVLQP